MFFVFRSQENPFISNSRFKEPNGPALPRVLPILALEVLHPGKILSPGKRGYWSLSQSIYSTASNGKCRNPAVA